ncbi:MAG: prepilin-type N-terminal cleavage/methylation domain-containing protein [Opitutaceae bacterium]|jgi:general secretion pathway protein I|nr:prepilin-type N-terminal cleavage/methylation domain-containing protein [Opitutaceae bacterium]HRG55919.1 prepilin-type N-terminal cleavage/methylation domain-containing protein [Lacunisphaera sp.]
MPPPLSRTKPTAFTLIEVLVSLAIFAFAAMVLGTTYVNVLTGYAAVAQRNGHDQDLRLVRAVLLTEPDRNKAEAGGDQALPGNRTAHWEARIGEAGVADLFRIRFRCAIRDPAQAQPWVREESFLLLRPTWSDPAIRDRLREAARTRLEKNRESGG